MRPKDLVLSRLLLELTREFVGSLLNEIQLQRNAPPRVKNTWRVAKKAVTPLGSGSVSINAIRPPSNQMILEPQDDRELILPTVSPQDTHKLAQLAQSRQKDPRATFPRYRKHFSPFEGLGESTTNSCGKSFPLSRTREQLLRARSSAQDVLLAPAFPREFGVWDQTRGMASDLNRLSIPQLVRCQLLRVRSSCALWLTSVGLRVSSGTCLWISLFAVWQYILLGVARIPSLAASWVWTMTTVYAPWNSQKCAKILTSLLGSNLVASCAKLAR